MDNGTTITIDPVTNLEPDMAKLHSFLVSLANAIVAATDLPKQITALTDQLASMKDTYDEVRAQRDHAEDRIDELTLDRDGWRAEASSGLETITELNRTLDETEADLSNAKDIIDRLTRDLASARAEAAAHLTAWTETQTKLEVAESKLNTFRSVLAIPEDVQPKAEPTVTVIEPIFPYLQESFTKESEPSPRDPSDEPMIGYTTDRAYPY